DVQRAGGLGVGELLPGDEQEDVAIAVGQLGQGGGERAAHGAGGDIGSDAVGVAGLGQVGPGGLADPELADLLAAVLADEVGGDPVQPRAGVAVGGEVPAALGERGQEGLGDEVIGHFAADPAGDVAVDAGGVPVKQQGEPLGLVPGALDDRGVVVELDVV